MYKEFGAESYFGEIPFYGKDSNDEKSFRYDYSSAESDSVGVSDIKLVADDGSISYLMARKPVFDEPKYSEPDLAE